MTQADLPSSNLPEDRPHKPADDREEVYFHGSPLLRYEMIHGWFWMLLGIILIAIPIVWHILSDTGAPWWAFVAGIVLGIICMMVPWIMSKTVGYKISNYRIDFEQGLISKKYDTLELWHVDDIRLSQSLLERVLCVGTITVISNDDTTPRLDMRGLPKPRPLFDALKQRIIAVKRQRGVVKMDMGGGLDIQ